MGGVLNHVWRIYFLSVFSKLEAKGVFCGLDIFFRDWESIPRGEREETENAEILHKVIPVVTRRDIVYYAASSKLGGTWPLRVRHWAPMQLSARLEPVEWAKCIAHAILAWDAK